MNVNLTPALERLIRKRVTSGLYNSQSEVVRQALRLLVEHERIHAVYVHHLRRSLAEGVRQADEGRLVDGRSVVKQIRASLRRRAAPGS